MFLCGILYVWIFYVIFALPSALKLLAWRKAGADIYWKVVAAVALWTVVDGSHAFVYVPVIDKELLNGPDWELWT